MYYLNSISLILLVKECENLIKCCSNLFRCNEYRDIEKDVDDNSRFLKLNQMGKAIYADNEARNEKKWFVQNAMIMMEKG